jgi:hypothetical protein
MIFERAIVWRITTGCAFVVIPLFVRTIAQSSTYLFYWNNEAEEHWITPEDAVNNAAVIMTACGFAAAVTLILVGLIIEHLRLSRNTFDVMLLNAQIAKKKLEEKKTSTGRANGRCSGFEQTKRLLEMMIHCWHYFENSLLHLLPHLARSHLHQVIIIINWVQTIIIPTIRKVEII